MPVIGRYRKIFGYVLEAYSEAGAGGNPAGGKPIANAEINFKLSSHAAIAEAVFMDTTFSAITNSAGYFEKYLWCDEDSAKPVSYAVSYPLQSGGKPLPEKANTFDLAFGDGSPVGIGTLVSASQSVVPGNPLYLYVNSLFENKVNVPTGDGTRFLADDNTYKTIQTGGGGGQVYAPATPTVSGLMAASDKEKFDFDQRAVIDARKFGAKGDNSTDDSAALNSAFAEAANQGGILRLPKGIYKVAGPLVFDSNNIAIEGAGRGLTKIYATRSGFDVLTIGSGDNALSNAGYARDFEINSAQRNEDRFAAIKLDGTTHFVLERVSAYVGDILLDLVNNNYGAAFHDLRLGFGGDANVGVRLGGFKNGVFASGSDLPFYNLWSAARVAVWIEENGGGYHFYGGQLAGGTSLNGMDENLGAVVVGKNYETGETGEASADFTAVSFEGTGFVSMVRSFDQANLQFHSCNFNPQESSRPALDVFHGTNMKNSRLKFNGYSIGGHFSRPQLLRAEGSYGNLWLEDNGHYNPAQNVRIGGAQDFIGSMAEQSNLQSNAVSSDWFGLNVGGVKLRGNNGLIEQSINRGANWEALKVSDKPVYRNILTPNQSTARNAAPTFDVAGNLTVTRETAVVTPGGTASIKLVANGNADSYVEILRANLDAGKKLFLSFLILADDPQKLRNVQIKSYPRNGNNDGLGELLGNMIMLKANQWTRVTAEFTLPPGTANSTASLSIYGQTAGEVIYLSDVQMYQA